MWRAEPNAFLSVPATGGSNFDMMTPNGAIQHLLDRQQGAAKYEKSNSTAEATLLHTPVDGIPFSSRALTSTALSRATTSAQRGPATGSAAAAVVAMLSSGVSQRYAPSTVPRAETETALSAPYSCPSTCPSSPSSTSPLRPPPPYPSHHHHHPHLSRPPPRKAEEHEQQDNQEEELPSGEPSAILRDDGEMTAMETEDDALPAALLASAKKATKEEGDGQPSRQLPSSFPSPPTGEDAMGSHLAGDAHSVAKAEADSSPGRRLYTDPSDDDGVVNSRYSGGAAGCGCDMGGAARVADSMPPRPAQVTQQSTADRDPLSPRRCGNGEESEVVAGLQEELRQHRRLLMHSRHENERLRQQIKAHTLRETFLTERLQGLAAASRSSGGCGSEGMSSAKRHHSTEQVEDGHRIAQLSEELVQKKRTITALEIQLSGLQGKLSAYEEAFQRGCQGGSSSSSSKEVTVDVHGMLCQCLSTTDYLVKVLNATTHCRGVPHLPPRDGVGHSQRAAGGRRGEKDTAETGDEADPHRTEPYCPRSLEACTIRCLQAALQGNTESQGEMASRGCGVDNAALAVELREELAYCERVCVRLAGSLISEHEASSGPTVTSTVSTGATGNSAGSGADDVLKDGPGNESERDSEEDMCATQEAAWRDAAMPQPPSSLRHSGSDDRYAEKQQRRQPPPSDKSVRRLSQSPSPWNDGYATDGSCYPSVVVGQQQRSAPSSSASTMSSVASSSIHPPSALRGDTGGRQARRRHLGQEQPQPQPQPQAGRRPNMQDCEVQ